MGGGTSMTKKVKITNFVALTNIITEQNKNYKNLEQQILEIQIKYNLNYYKENIMQNTLLELYTEFSNNLEQYQLDKLLEILNKKKEDLSVLKMLQQLQYLYLGDLIKNKLIKLILEYKITHRAELQTSGQEQFRLTILGQIIIKNKKKKETKLIQPENEVKVNQKMTQQILIEQFDDKVFAILIFQIHEEIYNDVRSSLFIQIQQFIYKYEQQYNLQEFFKKHQESNQCMICQAGLLVLIEYHEKNKIKDKDQQIKVVAEAEEPNKIQQIDKSASIITQQYHFNQSLKKDVKQDTSNLNWSKKETQQLMLGDFKQILTLAYKFSPFQSSVDESFYAQFYLNELHISLNLSNNLYLLINNNEKIELSQNKRELLDLLQQINQNGYQFKGHIKEVLDNYVNIHLSENGFKRHLYDLVQIPEDAQLDIEIELQKKYSPEISKKKYGLFVVEEQSISQIDFKQLIELLMNVRDQSLNKMKEIAEDNIYTEMKKDCFKTIGTFDQSEFVGLLKTIKNYSDDNKEFYKEAMKYYKPPYKATLEQFKDCDNEKIKEALRIILSGK